MRKAIIRLCFGGFILWVLFNAMSDPRKSAGTPIGHTGAPLDKTCNTSACHADGMLNAGPGILTIETDGDTNTYTPEASHDITVTITQSGISKFGFQALILTDADSTNAGTITLTDGLRTQILAATDSASPYFGRDYITHTADGNPATAPDTSTWTFRWTAPPTGAVTIYVASLAADGDETEMGDDVYTTTLPLEPDSATATSFPADADANTFYWRLYPNPFDKKLFIEPMHGTRGSKITLTLYDLSGRQMLTRHLNRSTQPVVVDVAALPRGIYVYQLKGSKQSAQRGKIIAQ